jgi:hypothetical protein
MGTWECRQFLVLVAGNLVDSRGTPVLSRGRERTEIVSAKPPETAQLHLIKQTESRYLFGSEHRTAFRGHI